MEINNKFNLGEIVHFITDSEQRDLIVTGILIRGNGITYEVSHNGNGLWVYSYELTTD